jgi:hypothetical protein
MSSRKGDKLSTPLTGEVVEDKPKNRVHGSVDSALFLNLIKEGYTQKEAYKSANSSKVTDKTATVEGSRVAKTLLSNPDTKRDFLEALKEKREQALKALTPDKLKKASAKDTAISLGILIEKVQLLAGEPTENIANLHLHVTKDELFSLNDADLEAKLLGN